MTAAERAARAMHQELAELGPRYGWPTQYPSWDDLPTNYQELTILAIERLFAKRVFFPGSAISDVGAIVS